MNSGTTTCIACAELIRQEASLCRYCGSTQEETNQSATEIGRARFQASRVARSGPGADGRSASTWLAAGIGAISGLLVLSLGVAFLLAGNQAADRLQGSSTDGAIPDGVAVESPDVMAMSVNEVYEGALPSVVTVECGSSFGSGFSYAVRPATGFRSVVVTNHHVVEECTFLGGPEVQIVTSQGERHVSELWSWDEEHDLAIVMIKPYLTPLESATEASIGDRVLAMGTPEGFAGSITAGIISQVYRDHYQTDAALNQGNSGGPLLDMTGRVLGINTWGFGREGLNIAVRPALLCKNMIACN